MAFCLLTALGLLATRLAVVDYRFLTLTTLPPHDMYQGAAFFATNLHALRLEGDLAWWNPTALFGYAQYYQSFLSPLAPTCGHVVFVLWAALIRALGGLGVALPEYPQYLVVTYVVLPLLAFVAFLWVCTLLFTSRAAALLAAIVYAFSGIGLWHSAWFYFQEPFTLFFLVGAAIAALRRPVASRLLLLLVAALVQIASFNYWSLYNAWFLALTLGTYAVVHGNQVRRLGRRLGELRRRHPVAVATSLSAATLTAGLWLVLIATVTRDQTENYIRVSGAGVYSAYTIEAAAERVQELRSFTTDLFNGAFTEAVENYPRENPMHSARYLGAELFPLLAAFAVMRWGRRERWLVACTTGVLCICLAPPLLLRLWAATPGMNHIQHLFYFYSHHFQVLVALAAAAGLDGILVRQHRAERQRVLRAVIIASITVSVLVLIELGVFSAAFPSRDTHLQAGLTFALASLVVGVPLLRQVWQPSAAHRRLLLGVLLTLTFADLTRYFWWVEQADIAFTVERRYQQPIENPFPAALQTTLGRPWARPNPAYEFNGGVFANMPLPSQFWPANVQVMPRSLMELASANPDAAFAHHPALQFFPRGQVRLAHGGAPEVAAPHSELLLGADGAAAPEDVVGGAEPRGRLEYRFTRWGYNDCAFALRTPGDGWLLIAQTFDPAWRITVDGRPVVIRRAEHMLMAVPVEAGARALEMDYRPRSRAIYWPAAALLIGTTTALLAASVFTRRSASAYPLS